MTAFDLEDEDLKDALSNRKSNNKQNLIRRKPIGLDDLVRTVQDKIGDNALRS